MMTSVQLKAHLLAAAQPTSPLAKCAALRDRLAEIQGSFADHLDTLRTGFPRLYFLRWASAIYVGFRAVNPRLKYYGFAVRP